MNAVLLYIDGTRAEDLNTEPLIVYIDLQEPILVGLKLEECKAKTDSNGKISTI